MECCPWNDAQTPLLRARRWNESSFMRLLLTGLNYNPLTFTDQSQEVFFSSHTAYSEGLRWLITAKSLEKGEKEGLTFNSAPGSLQEAGLWEATDYSPAACPAALCGTWGGLQWTAHLWACLLWLGRPQTSGASWQWSSMSWQSFQWPGRTDNHNNEESLTFTNTLSE